MALSAEDKKRLVELAQDGKRGREKRQANEALNLAGSAAAPVPVHLLGVGRGRNLLSRVQAYAPQIALVALPVLALVAWGTWYTYRYDLQRMDFGVVFDSRQGLSMRHRFTEQVRLQKQKRALLDNARAYGFANDYLAAVHKADQVLALEAGNAEAAALRVDALNSQVVYANGAFRSGDVDEAIARVQAALAEQPGHSGATDTLHACVAELVRRSETAFDAGDYATSGRLVHQAEGIRPGFAPALEMHARLVRRHVRRADDLFLQQEFVRALEDIVAVRRLEDYNERAEALFEKIEERISIPEIAINSIVDVQGHARIIATIEGQAAHLKVGDVFGNVRVVSIDPRLGEVVFQQIYTDEQTKLVKIPGSRGEWITAGR